MNRKDCVDENPTRDSTRNQQWLENNSPSSFDLEIAGHIQDYLDQEISVFELEERLVDRICEIHDHIIKLKRIYRMLLGCPEISNLYEM